MKLIGQGFVEMEKCTVVLTKSSWTEEVVLDVFPTDNIEPSRNLTIARESLTVPSCQRHYSTQRYIVGREQAHFHSFVAKCVFARYLYTSHGIHSQNWWRWKWTGRAEAGDGGARGRRGECGRRGEKGAQSGSYMSPIPKRFRALAAALSSSRVLQVINNKHSMFADVHKSVGASVQEPCSPAVYPLV